MGEVCLHEVVPRGVLFLLLEEERLDRLLLVELLRVVPLLHRHHRLWLIGDRDIHVIRWKGYHESRTSYTLRVLPPFQARGAISENHLLRTFCKFTHVQMNLTFSQ